MNTCLKGNSECNQKIKYPCLDHKSSCCNRWYCNLDCYFKSYHKCTKCGASKHVCEFKSIDSQFYVGICSSCWSCINTIEYKCYRCSRLWDTRTYKSCDKCLYKYCSQNCLNADHWNCPKCGNLRHRCEFQLNGNCKYCK